VSFSPFFLVSLYFLFSVLNSHFLNFRFEFNSVLRCFYLF
jgi:hypothetical protein